MKFWSFSIGLPAASDIQGGPLKIFKGCGVFNGFKASTACKQDTPHAFLVRMGSMWQLPDERHGKASNWEPWKPPNVLWSHCAIPRWLAGRGCWWNGLRKSRTGGFIENIFLLHHPEMSQAGGRGGKNAKIYLIHTDCETCFVLFAFVSDS